MCGLTNLIQVLILSILPILNGADNFCVGRTDGLYPYIADCTKFYQCSSGLAYIMDCPVGTKWNQPLETCETTCDQYHPELVVPTTVPQSTTEEATTVSIPGGCAPVKNLRFDTGVTLDCPVLEELTTSSRLECLYHCVRRTGCSCLNFINNQPSSNCALLQCSGNPGEIVTLNALCICL